MDLPLPRPPRRRADDVLPAAHPFRLRTRPLVLAHRGNSELAPENTLAAFRRALDDGADAIETDLWLTADGHFVCHHDATLARMAGDPRRLDAVSVADLAGLPVTGRHGPAWAGERVPLLAELLDLLPADILLVLELKDPRFRRAEVAGRLAAQVAERAAAFTVLAASFDMACLRVLQAVAPGFPIAHITFRNPWPTQPTDLVGPAWPLLFLNPLYCRLAHRRGQLVGVLDPVPERRLGWYLARGADAVLTNNPAVTRRALDRLRTR